ncbi:MAG: carbon starvation protein A [Opitutales bacterium]|nr:carbon starvation protein A [Opitutales bacterium]
MAYFFIGIILLVAGYFTYGRLIERIVAPTDTPTPAFYKRDGVDFLPLPHWKNMLIQLLNIAGVGPVIGVIIGIKFGEIAFLIIPVGNIIAGATHDYLSGMMSVRRGGANLPILIRDNLGGSYFKFFSVFSILLLLLVVAVFVNIPAKLFSTNFLEPVSDFLAGKGWHVFLQGSGLFWVCVGAIFAYYIVATLFSVDKIIGKIYPFFGAVLLLGTFALFVALCFAMIHNPSLLSESEPFAMQKWTAANGHPIVPLLFVTIACGIISGFHATQSPIIARTIQSERQGRSSFYGVMVLEGLIAMIWASGGLAVYNTFPEMFHSDATSVLIKITKTYLGSWMGALTVLGVIILAVTSGDTAMRAVRLSLAEILKIDQRSKLKRVLTCLPLGILVAALLIWSNMDSESFNMLWNYFAWGNQVLAYSTLMAASVWLWRQGKPAVVAIVPAAFMGFIVYAYIFWNKNLGFALSLKVSYVWAAAFVVLSLAFIFYNAKRGIKK